MSNGASTSFFYTIRAIFFLNYVINGYIKINDKLLIKMTKKLFPEYFN